MWVKFRKEYREDDIGHKTQVRANAHFLINVLHDNASTPCQSEPPKIGTAAKNMGGVG